MVRLRRDGDELLALRPLSTSLGARWVAVGRPPYANMWEFTVGFGWGIVLFHALFELRFRLFGGDGSSASGAAARMVGAVLLPVSFTMFAFALAYFPSEIRPLVPALQANRILGAHVATMMMSYSVLTVSFGAAVLYLIQNGDRRFARLPSGETLEEIANRSVLIGFPMLTLGIALGAYWAN